MLKDMRRPVEWSMGTATFAALAAAATLLYWAQSTDTVLPTRACAIAFSSDSKLLVAGRADGPIRIWSTPEAC
jgi:hypothetical protein